MRRRGGRRRELRAEQPVAERDRPREGYYREALAIFRARNLPVWTFDAIDEMWKATDGEGPVGAHWGIFTTARAPKQAATELMMMVK